MFRLLGLLAGLAGATDLGTGGQPDESLRRCVVAGRLARAVGADDAMVRDVVVVSLLEHVGCTAYAHEAAAIWGDDIATTHAALVTDADSAADVFRTFLPMVASGTGRSRPRVALTMARSMRAMVRDAPVATCEVAQEAGRRLGLDQVAQDSLGHMATMWNCKGFPRTGGERIPFPARVMHVAGIAVLSRGMRGDEAAVEQSADAPAASWTPIWQRCSSVGRASCWPVWTRRTRSGQHSTPSPIRSRGWTTTGCLTWPGCAGTSLTSRARGYTGTPRPSVTLRARRRRPSGSPRQGRSAWPGTCTTWDGDKRQSVVEHRLVAAGLRQVEHDAAQSRNTIEGAAQECAGAAADVDHGLVPAPVQGRELLAAGTAYAHGHDSVERRTLGGTRCEPAPEVVAEDPREHSVARAWIELANGVVPDASEKAREVGPTVAAE